MILNLLDSLSRASIIAILILMIVVTLRYIWKGRLALAARTLLGSGPLLMLSIFSVIVVPECSRAIQGVQVTFPGAGIVENKPCPEMDPETLRRVAIHEAGHAAVEIALGRGQDVVIHHETWCEDGLLGSAGTIDNSALTKRRMVEELAVLYGGFEATRKVYGDDTVDLGARQDMRNAAHMAANGASLLAIPGLDLDAINERVSLDQNAVNARYNTTIELLQEGQRLAQAALPEARVIEAVADEILAKDRGGSISAEDLSAILSAAQYDCYDAEPSVTLF